MKIIKKILALALVGILAMGLVACSNREQEDGSNIEMEDGKLVVRVGFVYPKTGTYSSYGKYTKEMTQYAIDKVNEKGLQIDGKEATLKLISADSASDATQAKKVAKELIEEHKVDLMLASKTSDTTVPVSKICEKYKVLCLSVDTPDDAWAVDKHTYSFHAGFDVETELEAFLTAWDQVDDSNKRVGIMHQNNQEGYVMDTKLPAFAKEHGYVAYDPGSYQAGQTDFSQIIENLQTQQVTLLAGVMSNSDFLTFYEQLKQSGYLGVMKVITIGKAALFEEGIEGIDLSGICTEIWWTEDFPTTSSIDGETSKEIADVFRQMTGKKVVPPTVGYDYANVEILYQVLRQAGTLDVNQLVKTCQNIEMDTIIGKIKYNEKNYSVQPLIYGQWIYDKDSKSWERKVISADQLEGFDKIQRLCPLERIE